MISSAIEYTELYDLLFEKRVIVVGRSHYLLDDPEYENQGEFIDSHDIIVRANHTHPPFSQNFDVSLVWRNYDDFIPPPYQHLLGKTTHIINVLSSNYSKIIKWLPHFSKNNGVCVLGSPTSSSVSLIKKHTSHISLSECNRIYFNRLYKHTTLSNFHMHSGISLIAYLLQYNIMSLHIIGFTSYMLPFEKERYNDEPESCESDLHWLSYMLNTDSRITTGPVLHNIIKEKSKNKISRFWK